MKDKMTYRRAAPKGKGLSVKRDLSTGSSFGGSKMGRGLVVPASSKPRSKYQ